MQRACHDFEVQTYMLNLAAGRNTYCDSTCGLYVTLAGAGRQTHETTPGSSTRKEEKERRWRYRNSDVWFASNDYSWTGRGYSSMAGLDKAIDGLPRASTSTSE